uniref:Malic enzyme n=1 Tax=Ditylenchus dipsaci TaxID=166011 RepID=A0A915CKZ2_9BILA
MMGVLLNQIFAACRRGSPPQLFFAHCQVILPSCLRPLRNLIAYPLQKPIAIEKRVNNVPKTASFPFFHCLQIEMAVHKKEWDLKDPKQKALFELYRPEPVIPNKRGQDLLKTRELNKGLGFSLHERQRLGVHGLLPPAFFSIDQQAYRVLKNLRDQPNDLARYIHLDGLQDRNERLFYKVVCENVKELLPVVYTPTVGLACQKFGYIYRAPKGVYVTINDNSVSQIYQILSNWPNQDVRAIVVTDGERILGLGDLGVYGMGIPVGKLALYVALGGVLPRWCLPVHIDVGTDNQQLLDDPYYIGLRKKRVRGEEYDSLIDNFMKACTKSWRKVGYIIFTINTCRFGQSVLIQFEDFGKSNAYRLLDRYDKDYCMFNDDVQGTASVVVAGLLAASRVNKKKIKDTKYVFLGGGTAATGVAELIIRQMESEGASRHQALDQIYLINTKGLVTKNRTKELDERLVPYAKDMPTIKDLLEIVKKVQPDALIGVSTVPDSFSKEVLEEMAKINKHPIIFPLSNPTTKSECSAENAYKYTNGTALFGAGSPFDNVEYNGRVFKPGQCNNSYIFPGVALGVIVFKISTIKNDLFLTAARVLAGCVTEKNISEGRIYPRIEEIREISIKIAVALGEESYKDGTAKLHPRPEDLEMYLRLHTYKLDYDQLQNDTYDWPQEDMTSKCPIPPIEHYETSQ